MNRAISTMARRVAVSILVFFVVFGVILLLLPDSTATTSQTLTDGEIMTRVFVIPSLAAFAALTLLTVLSRPSVAAAAPAPQVQAALPVSPFMAQVVGVQWLNPLQRRDYSTEWQLLWTLGLARPNKDDDMVKAEPENFSTLQVVGSIAAGNDGEETFQGYHHKYLREMMYYFRHIYFTSSTYFYNAHSKDRTTWRELAGIRVEYALPLGKLDPVEATNYTRKTINDMFDIGHPSFPNAWSRDTPPDVRVTMGGPNAGFTSLAAALDYLQTHPNETVWAMNWDAPSRPKDKQLNENIALLILAGPTYKTERDALAWIGYPATKKTTDFDAKEGLPSRAVQAFQAALSEAVSNGRKQNGDIGYVIHDANNRHPDSPRRLGNLAQTLTSKLPDFDFIKQTFNTSALLGEMGAGTALTNVALAIAYANHVGKNVLVAGTTDADQPSAVLVVPPEKVRPIDHDAPWFRARGENNAYLLWWGIRHDATMRMQGYSK